MTKHYSQNQKEYLNAMGIVGWALKIEKNSPSFLPFYTLECHVKQSIPVLLVADASKSSDQKVIETNLLAAIGKALDDSAKEPLLLNNFADMERYQQSRFDFIIFLGHVIAEKFFDKKLAAEIPQYLTMNGMNCLIHHSLSEMLEDASLKSKLWKDLRGKILNCG